MKRILVIGTMAAALAVGGASQAQAGLITGTLSLSSVVSPGCVPGTPAGNTCSPVLPVNGATGASTTLLLATGLDFTLSGVLTPGTAGAYDVNGASGDFTFLHLAGNGAGAIKDFSFAGLGSANYPTAPINTFELGLLGGAGFSMDLVSVTITFQGASSLILDGVGRFHLPGFDATLGTFDFTVSNTTSTFAFAASEGASGVPEPGSMVLLGTGLLGLAAAARRMRKA